MEPKHYIGLILLVSALVGATVLACLSHRWRDLFFFLLVAAAPVMDRFDVNFLSREWYRGTTRGLEVSVLDVLAVAVLVGVLLRPRDRAGPRWFWPAGLWPWLIFLGYGSVSVVLAEQKLLGWFEFTKLCRGLVVILAAAVYVRGPREWRLLVWALALAVLAEGGWALKQRYLDGVHRVSGTLVHANSLSMWLCLSGPVMLAAASGRVGGGLRLALIGALGMACLGILLTISRAGIPIFALVMLGTALMTVGGQLSARKVALGGLAALLGLIVLVRSWDSLAARYAESSFAEEYLDTRTAGRGMYLRQARVMVADRPFGVGLNNWSYAVSKTYGGELGLNYRDYDQVGPSGEREYRMETFAAPAHNLAALTVGELGWPGLVIFGLVWLRWFSLGLGFCWRRDRGLAERLGIGILFGLGGVFLQSLTEWTWRQTPIFFTCCLLVGTLAALVHWRQYGARRTEGRCAGESGSLVAQV